MTSKKFVVTTLCSILIIFILLSIFVIIVDPYFHYHKPLKNMTYTLDNQRYQNDGIVKHFDYDAIITGTSMTENFKTSELDELFNVHSIKVPFEGATFYEINNNLITAMNNNKNIKLILRCLDLYQINTPKDKLSYEKDSYPTYLYDNNIFNDIEYLLNRDIIINSINFADQSINKKKSTTFDDYSAWYNIHIFSKEVTDSHYERPNKSKGYDITNNDYLTIKENIEQNVTYLADKYPDIEFYLYYPPYSIYYWDKLNQNGILNKELDTIEYATKLLLEHDNIHLYSFLSEYDIVTNLDNYKDIEHHSEKVNSLILNKIKDNDDLVTKENFNDEIHNIRDFYKNYDYDKLFN